MSLRPDPLFNELANGIKTSSDDSSVRDTYLQALRLCLERAGDKMSPPIRSVLKKEFFAVKYTCTVSYSLSIVPIFLFIHPMICERVEKF